MKAEEIVESTLPHLKEVMKEFIRLSRRSNRFYRSDADITAMALCLRKFGKTYCDSDSWVGLPLNNMEDFLGAIEALRDAGYRPDFVSVGVSTVHISVEKWRQLRKLERSLRAAAKKLADELDFPVAVKATIIMTEDPARPCYSISVAAYGPQDEALMLRRILRLMAVTGTDPAEVWERASAGPTKPIRSLLTPRLVSSYSVDIATNCVGGEGTSLKGEEPEDYMICNPCMEEESTSHPTNCEGIKRVYLTQVIPGYEPGWDCVKAVRKTRGTKVLNKTEGMKYTEAVVRAGEHEFIIRCGEKRDDNFIDAEDMESLMTGIVILIRAYSRSNTSAVAKLDPRIMREFIKRVTRASDPCEVIDLAWELEDV